jgi:RNA polymerase sigma-70 factor (ECF subfamily)
VPAETIVTSSLALPLPDDARLVEAVRRRQRGAAALVYRRHVHAVHAVLARKLGARPDVEDLLQEVFASALGSIHKLRDPTALRPWLIGITLSRLRAYDRWRRRKHWLTFLAPEELPELATSPDERHAEMVREVCRLLARLPADERIALILHRVEGRSISASAGASGMSISTFKRRLSRGEARFFAQACRRPALAAWVEGRWSTPEGGASAKG